MGYLGRFLLISIVGLASCNKNTDAELNFALGNSGDNRQELEKVLEFYRDKRPESLKYKAAVFLIKNIPYHFYRQAIPGFDLAFNRIEGYPESELNNYREEAFKNILDSISKKNLMEYNPI